MVLLQSQTLRKVKIDILNADIRNELLRHSAHTGGQSHRRRSKSARVRKRTRAHRNTSSHLQRHTHIQTHTYFYIYTYI
jgi:hypothetical protein